MIPWHFDFSPDNSMMFVANSGSNSITVFKILEDKTLEKLNTN